jgi:hypothetical protein
MLLPLYIVLLFLNVIAVGKVGIVDIDVTVVNVVAAGNVSAVGNVGTADIGVAAPRVANVVAEVNVGTADIDI